MKPSTMGRSYKQVNTSRDITHFGTIRIDSSASVARSIKSRSPKPMDFSHAGLNPVPPHFIFFYIFIIWPFPVSSVCVCGGGGYTNPLWIRHWTGPPGWVLSFLLHT